MSLYQRQLADDAEFEGLFGLGKAKAYRRFRWYKTLCDRLKPLATFEDAVRLTIAVAKEALGTAESRAVKEGWKAFGL